VKRDQAERLLDQIDKLEKLETVEPIVRLMVAK
jgi:hypothetical protein